MSYDELVKQLDSAHFTPFINRYYAGVARCLEPSILEPSIRERTKEELDKLKDVLICFVLRWYKELPDDPRQIADPAGFAELTEFDALPEFVIRVQAAGYDYSEWDAVLKSFQLNKLALTVTGDN